jgi:hypothetical protein
MWVVRFIRLGYILEKKQKLEMRVLPAVRG